MKFLKLENTYLNIKRARRVQIEENGDVLVVFRKKEAYRFNGKKAELLKKYLLQNHIEAT
ncbi:MAG: hypothetical protein CMF59_06045 [Leptospiraceae bacterium]|nr:hypothetical protein [Leptospiraceae bacterium]|tara:strand:- start:369 stop:548 length:180 start_codon:yes stop_codon:yes gene_type:complete